MPQIPNTLEGCVCQPISVQNDPFWDKPILRNTAQSLLVFQDHVSGGFYLLCGPSMEDLRSPPTSF